MFWSSTIILKVILLVFLLKDLKDSHAVKYGEPIDIEKFPYLVPVKRIESQGPSLPCTGTVVHNYWVLTAGHCVFDQHQENVQLTPNQLKIYVGSAQLFKGQEYDVTKVMLHPQYNYAGHDRFNHDLALVKTKERMNVKKTVALPSPQKKYNLINKTVKIMGWGYNENNVTSEILLGAELKIGNCSNSQDWVGDRICTTAVLDGQPQVSLGDSGGPILYYDNHKWIEMGSLSVIRDNTQFEFEDYTVYFNTQYYLRWIERTIHEN